MRLRVPPRVVVSIAMICIPIACHRAPEKLSASTASLTLSVDMPKEQTLQFLKQSATTLKLSPVPTKSSDAIVTNQTQATVSGPVAGPVTVVFSGNSIEANKWSQMMLDKLPAKKLK
jgi:hypothetical protein